jgi:hypothetical protein
MQSIYITKTEHGYNVCIDGKFADSLTPEEVLGTVAEALYSGAARFTKTPEQIRARERSFGAQLERQKFEDKFPQLFRDFMAEEHAEHIKDANQ